MSGTIFISVRAVDDGLTQLAWSDYVMAVNAEVRSAAARVHGSWISCPTDPWRGACWSIELPTEAQALLRGRLIGLAWEHRQDCVAWAEASVQLLGAQAPQAMALR